MLIENNVTPMHNVTIINANMESICVNIIISE